MPTPLYTKCKNDKDPASRGMQFSMEELTEGISRAIKRWATVLPPDQGHVEMSVAAGGRNAAVARGGDGLIRARHRQLQLRLDESQFGRLALDT